MRSLVLGSLLLGCTWGVGAPAPLPRPISRGDLIGYWKFDWTSENCTTYLFADGTQRTVWRGYDYEGKWLWDGKRQTLFCHERMVGSGCDLYEYHVRLKRDGGKIIGKDHNFRR